MRISTALRRIEELVAGSALFLALWIVCQEIAGRYLFNQTYTWTEDFTRVLLVTMAYLGAATVARDDEHIRVEFLTKRLPTPLRMLMKLAVDTGCIAFSLTACIVGINFVRETAALGLAFAHSNLPIPVWVAHLIIPVGFGFIAIRLSVRMISELHQWNSTWVGSERFDSTEVRD